MANRITHKKSAVAAKVPLPSDLQLGELAINTADKVVYSLGSDGTVFTVGTGLADVITAGTYTKVTVTSKGVVTSATTLASSDIPTSVALTGSPTAPTATAGTNTTQIATTAFTTTAIANAVAGNVASATKLQTARTINGVAFDGTSNITVADSTKVAKAGDTMTGELISTYANSYRMAGGTYGAFWRNDNTTFYLMQTASGDPYGSWNTYRPFSVTLATGAVSIGAQGLTVPGAATFNSTIYSTGDIIVRNGTVETHVLVGNTNGYLYGNTTNIGLYMPTGGANLSLGTSGNGTFGGTFTITGLATCSSGINVNGAVANLNGGANVPWMELRSNGGTPSLDFTNDNTNDYDTRFILESDGHVHVYGGSLYSQNWFRASGSSGFYCQDYGGGIHMTDTTWLRSYNGKSFYTYGEIAASGNVTAYYSDERLKDILRPVSNALSTIRGWRCVHYRANELGASFGYDPDRDEVGFIAQDVQKNAPELVTRAPFDLDVEPMSSKSGENYLTLKYERSAPYLAAAIMELEDKHDAEIKVLKDEISELKTLVKQLLSKGE